MTNTSDKNTSDEDFIDDDDTPMSPEEEKEIHRLLLSIFGRSNPDLSEESKKLLEEEPNLSEPDTDIQDNTTSIIDDALTTYITRNEKTMNDTTTNDNTTVDKTSVLEDTMSEKITTATSTKPKKPHSKLWILITALIAVALLIAAGIIGVVIRHNMVVTDCDKANSAYTTAYQAYEKQYKQAQEVAQTITSADQVADKATYTTFDKLTKTKLKKTAALNCAISYTDTFSASTSALDSQTHTVTQTTADLKKAVKNVQDSKDEKELNDARTNAQTQLDQANNLYTSSEGQVADNATRDSLKTRIDEAQKVLTDKKATVDGLTKVLAPLSDAVNQVNQSIQAKAQADEQARQQAQAQAQQQQAQAQRSQRRSGGSTYSGGSTGGNRTGGSTGRSYTNNGGNNGGNTGGSSGGSTFDWRSALNNQKPGACEAAGTCSQAIG